MGAQMFVCLPVGMSRANGNSNPCMDLNEILHTYPHLSKEGYGAVLNPLPHPSGPRGPETLEAEEHIIENCLQNKRCSAGCKLIKAAPGASTSDKNKTFPLKIF